MSVSERRTHVTTNLHDAESPLPNGASMKRVLTTIPVLLLILAVTASSRAGDVGPLVDQLKAVGPGGQGSAAAAKAWAELSKADVGQIPEILATLNGANPLAANWIRTAVDAIVDRAAAGGTPLPAKQLEAFVMNRTMNPRARRLAYELLLKADPSADRLVPGFLDDPSVELRRDAVVLVIAQADELDKAGKKDEATALYEKAFHAARDRDQIQSLAGLLKKRGREQDLGSHFGFVRTWKVIGPFDNTDEKGFDVVYPPEKELDAGAKYEGKHGEVAWKDYVVPDAMGILDFNKALEEEKFVFGYAWAEFESPKARDAQIRISSYNALKVWLNGKLIDEHKVYHGGWDFDQYIIPVTLKKGTNTILIKAGQNNQPQSWAKMWRFALRVCDATGGSLLPNNTKE